MDRLAAWLVHTPPMNAPTDWELLDRSVRGDRDAFAQIVDRYQSLVCSVAYSVIGDSALSEIAASEPFLAARGELHENDDTLRTHCGGLRGPLVDGR